MKKFNIVQDKDGRIFDEMGNIPFKIIDDYFNYLLEVAENLWQLNMRELNRLQDDVIERLNERSGFGVMAILNNKYIWDGETETTLIHLSELIGTENTVLTMYDSTSGETVSGPHSGLIHAFYDNVNFKLENIPAINLAANMIHTKDGASFDELYTMLSKLTDEEVQLLAKTMTLSAWKGPSIFNPTNIFDEDALKEIAKEC